MHRSLLVPVLVVLALAPASLAGSSTVLPGFRSPSGNIRCLDVPGPPAFLSCTSGKADEPSTQHPSYVTPAYGRTWRQGVFTCRSRVTGVTCTNPAKHGFFVTRQSWRGF